MPVITDELDPVEDWKEIIKLALPTAEKYGIVMCPEIHIPIKLESKMVKDFVEFIDETKTSSFGLNIDFGIFRNVYGENDFKHPGYTENKPKDLIPLLSYVKCCHAKFVNMNDDFEETTIPYGEIIDILIDNNWEGYLLSEYEGADKYDDGYEVGQTLRKHHIMLKRMLSL